MKIRLAIIIVFLLLIPVALGLATPKTSVACGFFQTCTSDNVNADKWSASQKKEAVATEENQRRLLQAQPIPKVEHSQERDNLIRRLETFNTPDKVSYIYLVSYGKVMAFYTVKGKISSVNSYLTTGDQVVDRYGNQCGSLGSVTDCWVVESPDLDGSYGQNPDAIFFYTAEGAYVEWAGDYMMSDQPLKLTTQPELVREIK